MSDQMDQRDASGRRVYSPDGAQLAAFILDRSPVSLIRGPIGSGKSVASLMKIWSLACEQRPGPDGIRRTRWGVVRNTFPELKGTTVKTWLQWFDEGTYGAFKWSVPFEHRIRVGDVDMEVFFLALDRPEDVRKLRSLEVTGWWLNECQFSQKEIFDEALSRTGRYPAVRDGGPTWHGLMGDMNAPGEDSWLALLGGDVPWPEDLPEDERQAWPSSWAYFRQPPGLIEVLSADGKSVASYRENPAAENRRWLPDRYYLDQVVGKSKAWIDSRVMNRVTTIVDGSPVWRQYVDEVHCAKEPLRAAPNHPLWIGLDFGRRPAAVVAQWVNGRAVILDELVGRDEGASSFAPRLKALLAQKYPGMAATFVGDPKGRDKTQADENTAYDVFRTMGMPVRPAPVKGNAIATRLEAVEHLLTGMVDGRPKFLISPTCRTLRAAMRGGYRFRKDDLQRVEPVKDGYSDIADATGYVCLGMGAGREMTGRAAPNTSAAKMHWGPIRGPKRRV
jgi:hypothetical protein